MPGILIKNITKNNLMKLNLFLSLFLSLSVFGTEISLMTYNVENLFDTKDDIGKDDKAFLPASMKRNVYHQGACQGIRVKKWREECLNLDWNEDAKNNKILNIVKVITSFDSNGADIVAFQEIENVNVLKDLFKLLEPYGYKDHVLLEGKDYRGIDSAVVSKFPIKQSKLHYVKFSPGLRKRDTRPILEAKIDIFGTDLIVYSVHFPAPFLDAVLRKESFNSLEGLLNSHDDPAIAMGDFNVTTEEELELNTFQDQSNIWFVSHREGCEECRGTYYYEPKDDWSFLDVILVSKGRKISFVVVHHISF